MVASDFSLTSQFELTILQGERPVKRLRSWPLVDQRPPRRQHLAPM